MKFIIGLGNPGKEFINTRHNVGFMVLDYLVDNFKEKLKDSNLKFKKSNKFKAEILKINNLLLVKPQTFMNNSGEAVKKILEFYKNKKFFPSLTSFTKFLYVIHDDWDIVLGEYKIQFAKGPKNHGGINSIEKHLKTKDFWRIRIGINNLKLKNKKEELEGKDFVLQKFPAKELKEVSKVFKKISEKKFFENFK